MALTDDHRKLQELVRDLLADRSPESEVRRAAETEAGFDPALWSALATELGLCGLAVPRSLGGDGYSLVEVGLVLEELGRALACVPYFSSVLLAQTLLLSTGDDVAARRWLPDLAAGRLRAAVAVAELSGRWEPDAVATAALRDGLGWRLRGTKQFVVDGHTADLLLVLARGDAGLSLFAVEARAEGLTRDALPSWDRTRKQTRVQFGDTPAIAVGPEGRGWDAVRALLPVAAVGLSMEAVGGMARVLEMSVEYAKLREQFGRPIGSFQAIKHKCADMYLAVESSRSTAYHALALAEDPGEELADAAALAHAHCAEAYVECAAENIQVHGGIGFTWEHPAHLYYQRAQTNRQLIGDPVVHRAAVAARMGL